MLLEHLLTLSLTSVTACAVVAPSSPLGAGTVASAADYMPSAPGGVLPLRCSPAAELIRVQWDGLCKVSLHCSMRSEASSGSSSVRDRRCCDRT